MKNAKKVNNKKNNFSKLFTNKKVIIVIFVILFGIVGAVILSKSFAQSTSFSFNGKLYGQQATKTYSVTSNGAGTITSTLTWSKRTTLNYKIIDPTGLVIATVSGVSPLNISAPVNNGKYTLSVSGSAGYRSGLPFSIAGTVNTVDPLDTLPPTAPSQLSATLGADTTTSALKWTASTDNFGIKEYRVFRNGQQVATTTSQSLTDSGLAKATLYTYTVFAYDAAGNVSTASNTATVTTPGTVTTSAGTPIEAYGAVGNGTTDDTAALNKAFASAPVDSTILLSPGKVYRHTGVLNVTVSGLRITGNATLLATNEQYSSVWLSADNILLDGGVIVKNATATKRWDAFEQMGLRINGHSGITVKDVTVDGSAATGIYIGSRATNYVLTDVTVQNTRADGIHNTGGATNGTITRPIVRNVGDDGVAVVSYANDGTVVSNITVQSPRFYGNAWGRAFSVVGGQNIIFSDVYAENSNGAAIYVAAEGGWNSHGVKNVKFLGGTLNNSNLNSAVDHGAILVYNSQPTYTIDTVDLENLAITNTRSTASRQTGILGTGSAGIFRTQMRNMSIVGGPKYAFYSDQPATSYNNINWTFNSAVIADKIGFSPTL